MAFFLVVFFFVFLVWFLCFLFLKVLWGLVFVSFFGLCRWASLLLFFLLCVGLFVWLGFWCLVVVVFGS